MSNLYTKFKTKLFWRIWSNAPSVCFKPKNTKIITNLTIFGKIALFGIVFFAFSYFFTTLSIMGIFFILALFIATFYPIMFAMSETKLESSSEKKLSGKLEDDFIDSLINESEFKKYYPRIIKKEKIIEQRKQKSVSRWLNKKKEVENLIKEIKKEMESKEQK